jgi:hypothetical protein
VGQPYFFFNVRVHIKTALTWDCFEGRETQITFEEEDTVRDKARQNLLALVACPLQSGAPERHDVGSQKAWCQARRSHADRCEKRNTSAVFDGSTHSPAKSRGTLARHSQISTPLVI